MVVRDAIVARNRLPRRTRVPCLTFIRHPVERLVSLFYYWMRDAPDAVAATLPEYRRGSRVALQALGPEAAWAELLCACRQRIRPHPTPPPSLPHSPLPLSPSCPLDFGFTGPSALVRAGLGLHLSSDRHVTPPSALCACRPLRMCAAPRVSRVSAAGGRQGCLYRG
jgi:hypothetical protein